MKKHIFSFLLLLLPLAALYAQSPVITHYTKKGEVVKEPTEAYFYRIVARDEQSPGLFKYLEFYTVDNAPKTIGRLSKMTNIYTTVGDYSTFHPNGQLYQKQVFNDSNLLIDTAFSYYPNGILYTQTFHKKGTNPSLANAEMADSKDETAFIRVQDSLGNKLVEDGNGQLWLTDLTKDHAYYEQGPLVNHKKHGDWNGKTLRYSFKETWNNGVLISGVSIDSTGQEVVYDENSLYSTPEYPGGINKLRRDVVNNYQYPKKAIEADVSGSLMVQFIVEKDGSMADYKIIKDLGYGTGENLIKVLRQQGRKWSPGLDRGRPVRVSYRLPLTMSLGK